MGRAFAWAIFVIFAAFVERAISSADFSTEAQFNADVYIGASVLSPTVLSELTPNRSRGHSLEEYDETMRRNLFGGRLHPYINNLLVVRMRNTGSEAISNVSIRLPRSADGYVFSRGEPIIFSRSEIVEVDEIPPNHGVIVMAFFDHISGLSFFDFEDDRFAIQSSLGRPAVSIINNDMLTRILDPQEDLVGEWVSFLSYLLVVVILASAPFLIAYFVQREKMLLLVDDDYYAAERRSFLAERGRDLLRARAAEELGSNTKSRQTKKK